MTVTTRVAGIIASAALTFGAFGVAAHADDTDDATTAEACASQQAKVDKAAEALLRVTAVFARQQERVAEKQEVVAEANAGREKAAARHALKAAKDALKETKATKRAQQMRHAKALERLTACEAEQPETTEAPTPA